MATATDVEHVRSQLNRTTRKKKAVARTAC